MLRRQGQTEGAISVTRVLSCTVPGTVRAERPEISWRQVRGAGKERDFDQAIPELLVTAQRRQLQTIRTVCTQALYIVQQSCEARHSRR